MEKLNKGRLAVVLEPCFRLNGHISNNFFLKQVKTNIYTHIYIQCRVLLVIFNLGIDFFFFWGGCISYYNGKNTILYLRS